MRSFLYNKYGFHGCPEIASHAHSSMVRDHYGIFISKAFDKIDRKFLCSGKSIGSISNTGPDKLNKVFTYTGNILSKNAKNT